MGGQRGRSACLPASPEGCCQDGTHECGEAHQITAARVHQAGSAGRTHLRHHRHRPPQAILPQLPHINIVQQHCRRAGRQGCSWHLSSCGGPLAATACRGKGAQEHAISIWVGTATQWCTSCTALYSPTHPAPARSRTAAPAGAAGWTCRCRWALKQHQRQTADRRAYCLRRLTSWGPTVFRPSAI